jgi:hypothetical protein
LLGEVVVVVVGFFVGCCCCCCRGRKGFVALLGQAARQGRGAVAGFLDAVRDGAVLGVGHLAAEEDGARDLEADDARVGVRAEAGGGAGQVGERVVAREERWEFG